MTAVEGSADVVGLMVVQWQTAPSALVQKQLANAILEALRPTFERVVGRFGARARGSLGPDDLRQVARLEAFKFMSKFDIEAARSSTFADHVWRRALRACEEQVRMHASDVRVGDWSARGRVTVGGVTKNRQAPSARPSVSCFSTDAKGSESDDSKLNDESHDDRLAALSQRVEDHEVEAATPEKLLETEQDRQALALALSKLSPEARALVRDTFGIGRDDVVSLRSNAERRNVPRSRLANDLEAALLELREAMG